MGSVPLPGCKSAVLRGEMADGRMDGHIWLSGTDQRPDIDHQSKPPERQLLLNNPCLGARCGWEPALGSVQCRCHVDARAMESARRLCRRWRGRRPGGQLPAVPKSNRHCMRKMKKPLADREISQGLCDVILPAQERPPSERADRAAGSSRPFRRPRRDRGYGRCDPARQRRRHRWRGQCGSPFRS